MEVWKNYGKLYKSRAHLLDAVLLGAHRLLFIALEDTHVLFSTFWFAATFNFLLSVELFIVFISHGLAHLVEGLEGCMFFFLNSGIAFGDLVADTEYFLVKQEYAVAFILRVELCLKDSPCNFILSRDL